MKSKSLSRVGSHTLREAFCEQLEPRTLLTALPAGFAETQVASGLVGATAMTVAPDGRVFITGQDGKIRIVQNGKLLPTPFLSLTTSYGQASQGIMGIALDPNFESNGFVYVDYTVGGSTSFQRISRFTASGNVASPASQDILFQVGPQTSFGHVGGGLTFGSDGMLYFSYGDANIPNIATLAPQLNNFYGKILRIEPDGTIPASNPFYNATTGNYRAIWAYGIRQAFKMSEQSTTGLIYIADVGEGTWEDIFKGVAGANYGWPTTEGPTSLAGITPPVYAYQHTGSSTGAYSITGGSFYDPSTDQFPSQYVGNYFFADWGTGQIETLNPASPSTAHTFATGAFDIVGMDAAPDGSLYYLTRGDENYGLDSPNGQLFQITYTGSQGPSIAVPPANTAAAVGSTATFSVAASGTGPFTYQWQENNSDIPGANSASYTTGGLGDGDDGSTFDVVVGNDFGSVASTAAVLSVTPDSPPSVKLNSPAAVSFYTAGKSLAYSASATDSKFGTLPGSDFAWTVALYHDNTITTVQSTTGVTSGSYFVPSAPLNDADAFYRVSLTVTNPDGLSTTAYQEVFPNASYIDLGANVPGVQLTVDGAAVTTPYSFLSIAGTTHTIAAVSPQTVAGTAYAFSSWSDGGAASHTITTPVTAVSNSITPVTTYTANFSTTTTVSSKLVITQQPTASTAGVALSPNLVVHLEDANGNLLSTNSSTVTLALATFPTGGTLTGSATATAVNGIATFTGLSLNVAGTYTFKVTDGAFTAAVSSSITVSTASTTAGKLVITQQPTTGTAGVTLSPNLVVHVENASGTLLNSNTSTVTLSLATFPVGGTLTGTATAKVVNGIATFTGLSLKIAGAYTFKVTDGTLTAAVSKTITIAHTSGAKLVVAQQPTAGTAGVALGTALVVHVDDAFGNFDPGYASTATLAISTGPTGGKLIGTATAKIVAGVATFTGLSLKVAGAYTFKVTAGTLTAALSKPITISSAAAAKLVIVQQPTTGTHAVTLSPAVIVDVEDIFGNIVITDASTITLAISANSSGGILNGTKGIKAVKGVAKYGALSFSKAGTYTLKATDGKLTAAISKSVVVK